MLSLYPNQSYPLEVLCSHYLNTGKTHSVTLRLSLPSSHTVSIPAAVSGAQDEGAVSSFSRLLTLAPNSGLGHLGLGTKALHEGRFRDAIKELQQGYCGLQQKLDFAIHFAEIK